MSESQYPTSPEEIRFGPIRVVDVFAAPAPADKKVTRSLGTETVPFDEIRDLICKPLARPSRPTTPS